CWAFSSTGRPAFKWAARPNVAAMGSSPVHCGPSAYAAKPLKMRQNFTPGGCLMLQVTKRNLLAVAAAGAIALAVQPASAQSGQPITIGFGMALTGPL